MLNPISANSANLSFANVGDVAFTIILPNEHFSFAQYDLIMFSLIVFRSVEQPKTIRNIQT